MRMAVRSRGCGPSALLGDVGCRDLGFFASLRVGVVEERLDQMAGAQVVRGTKAVEAVLEQLAFHRPHGSGQFFDEVHGQVVVIECLTDRVSANSRTLITGSSMVRPTRRPTTGGWNLSSAVPCRRSQGRRRQHPDGSYHGCSALQDRQTPPSCRHLGPLGQDTVLKAGTGEDQAHPVGACGCAPSSRAAPANLNAIASVAVGRPAPGMTLVRRIGARTAGWFTVRLRTISWSSSGQRDSVRASAHELERDVAIAHMHSAGRPRPRLHLALKARAQGGVASKKLSQLSLHRCGLA